MTSENTVDYEPIENYFDQFCAATTYEGIYLAFKRLCDAANLRSLPGCGQFYRELRQHLSFYWKAEAIFTNLDLRFNEITYGDQTVCENIQVLVVGSGPCGLRSAIELATLGANVVVIDKRTSFSRNNVLHLWPFLISDLKSLGAKSFFGKFCAGSIDHISIRTLQCILLKVALLFGVQIISGVEFQKLIQPSDDDAKDECLSNGYVSNGDGEEKERDPMGGGNVRPLRNLFTLYTGEPARYGWRVEVKPHHEALSTFEFDAIVDASGKSNSCLNFPRKVLRYRLAIAITVNFINYHDVEEAHVEEISGVASIFNQPYFAQISKKLGIELENLVYYKDETHYFVMTIKKRSLLEKGILIRDFDYSEKLLSSDNVNSTALQQLTREIATFATQGRLKRLDFALNSRGEPDVAVFDFTSLSAAQYACSVADRKGRPLCQCLVGDALLEPFWPRGSGCALGFLSALDAAWAISLFAAGHHALRVIAWRDSIYQRLSQASPSNMPSNFAAYTLIPNTRYTYADLELVRPMQVRHLYDSDVIANMTERKSFTFLRDSVKFDDPDIVSTPKNGDLPKNHAAIHYIPLVSLLKWYQFRLSPYPESICPPIFDLSTETWSDGRALRCLLHKYRPALVAKNTGTPIGLEETMRLFAENFGAPTGLTPQGWPKYLMNLYDCLIKHDPAFVANMTIRAQLISTNGVQNRRSFMVASPTGSIRCLNRYIDPLASPRVSSASNIRSSLSPRLELRRVDVGKLRRNLENPSTSVNPPASTHHIREEVSNAVEKGLMSKRRSEFIAMLNDPASAKRRSLLIDWEKAFEEAGLPPPPSPPNILQHPHRDVNSELAAGYKEKSRDLCAVCKKPLYAAESRAYDGFRIHPKCFRCVECQRPLRPDIAHCQYHLTGPEFYCTNHFHTTSKKTSTSGSSKMSTRAPIAPKPRTSNAPSVIYNLPNPTPPSPRPRWSAVTGGGTTSNVSSLTSDITSNIQPRAARRRQTNSRRWSVLRGIRDEPAPPVLLNARSGVPGTLGLPECIRRAAFDERLYRLNGSIQTDDFLSDTTSYLLDENEEFFASSEEDLSDRDTTGNIVSTGFDESPIITIDEATQLCRIRRDENLYLRHHPPTESSSKTYSGDSESDEDSRISTVETFDTPEQAPDYVNARWTLMRPYSPGESNPTPTALNPPNITNINSVEPSPLVQKYGLSAPVLLAKQRFLMADPEPIRIDSKAFRAGKNKERTTETIIPDCTEEVGYIPEAVPITLPLINDLAHSSTLMNFHFPSELIKIIPQICSPEHLNLPVHNLPIEPMISLPPLHPPKSDTLSSPIVTENVHMTFGEGTELRFIRNDTVTIVDTLPPLTHSLPKQSSSVLSEAYRSEAFDGSTVVSEYNRVLEPISHGDCTIDATEPLASSSSESESESDDGLELLHRSVIYPPAELSQHLKENIDQVSRQKAVPLYMLTSKLDSDDDQRLMDPHEALDYQDDEEEDTTESSSEEEPPLPEFSEVHAKEIAALKARLSQLEKEMLELEVQGAEKERALRELEESAGQRAELDLGPQIPFTSEPDLSISGSPKRETESRWRWIKPKGSANRTASNSAHNHPEVSEREMTERPEKAQLFSDLLSLISQRNKLVTQEAIIMAELKKIELEAYEESLRKAYDSLRLDREARNVKIGGAFKRRGAGRFKKERIYPANRDLERETKEKMLLEEIRKVSKEKTALTAVQGETIQRSNLQELSVREVLSRGRTALRRIFSPSARSDTATTNDNTNFPVTTTTFLKNGTSDGAKRYNRRGIHGH